MGSAPKHQAGSLELADLPRFSDMDDLPREQASEAFVARSLIDILALDSQLEEQLAKHASPKDFKLVLWRQEPDTTGSNWNARIERIQGTASDCSWWGAVPQMRERFNLI